MSENSPATLGCPMAPNPFTKQYLMTAGPTPVPPAVSQAMATPMLYHRAPAFVELYERVLAKLPDVARRTLTWDQGSEMARHDVLAALQ